MWRQTVEHDLLDQLDVAIPAWWAVPLFGNYACNADRSEPVAGVTGANVRSLVPFFIGAA